MKCNYKGSFDTYEANHVKTMKFFGSQVTT